MFALQWNISDHFHRHRTAVALQLDDDALASATDVERDVPAFDALWMRIYTRLADLCVDSRPAVRKSAGQTLFSMLGVHGETLQRQSWSCVLNKVRDK